MPRESLDAAENLPKKGQRQGALGLPQDEVRDVPDEAAAGLEEPHQTGSYLHGRYGGGGSP